MYAIFISLWRAKHNATVGRMCGDENDHSRHRRLSTIKKHMTACNPIDSPICSYIRRRDAMLSMSKSHGTFWSNWLLKLNYMEKQPLAFAVGTQNQEGRVPGRILRGC